MIAIRATSRCIKTLCASLVLSLPVLAAVEDNTILALEPLQGMVVVKTAAGVLEMISIGDAFPDSDVIVIIPKMLAVAVALIFFFPWMMQTMVVFTQNLFENLNFYVR